MKTRVYLRIGQSEGGKVKFAVSSNPNNESLSIGSYNSKRYVPTVLIALDLTIDDREFNQPRIFLEADIQHTEPAAEIRQVGIEELEDERDNPN